MRYQRFSRTPRLVPLELTASVFRRHRPPESNVAIDLWHHFQTVPATPPPFRKSPGRTWRLEGTLKYIALGVRGPPPPLLRVGRHVGTPRKLPAYVRWFVFTAVRSNGMGGKVRP